MRRGESSEVVASHPETAPRPSSRRGALGLPKAYGSVVERPLSESLMKSACLGWTRYDVRGERFGLT
jgi:hypothetical protein